MIVIEIEVEKIKFEENDKPNWESSCMYDGT